MIIKDESVLLACRMKRRCEVCRRLGPVEPHHIMARGMGGGSRLDHPWNLVAICRLCHTKAHMGSMDGKGENTVQEALFEIVAQREGLTVDLIEVELYWLRRLPKKDWQMTLAQLEIDFDNWVRSTACTVGPLAEWLRIRLQTATPTERIQLRAMCALRGKAAEYDRVSEALGGA